MNPALLQKQLRENSNDLQDFCKDLESWGDDMKRKEDALKGETAKKKLKIPNKNSTNLEKKPKETVTKIGSTDYSKWEKFDADLECERLEEDYKDDSELTDEFEESQIDEAIMHKEKGNSYVKSKNWDKAIECYTKAINCNAFDPIYYANRALCYLKMNRFISAEEDCTLSLRLDKTYVKALLRRAAARQALGKLKSALNDIEVVLTYEPKNPECKIMLESIRKKGGLIEKPPEENNGTTSKFAASRPSKSQPALNIEKTHNNKPKIQSSSWPDFLGCEITNVRAIKKPPHIRSKKPLKRMEIKEINSLETTPMDNAAVPKSEQHLGVKKHVVENKAEIEISDDTGGGEPIEKTSAFRKNRTNQDKKNVEFNTATSSSWPHHQANNNNEEKTINNCVINCEDLKICEKNDETVENKPKELKNDENRFIITQMDKTSIEKRDDIIIQQQFVCPKTAVQFYGTWKLLKSMHEKYLYVKLIHADEIPNIFKESLDSEIFSDILRVLSTSFIDNQLQVYEILYQLTRVRRFSTLAMFMDPSDKNCLWKLITYIRANGEVCNEKLDNLILLYEL